MKSSNNAPWYGLSAKGVAYRVSVFFLNVSKPADLAFSFVSTVRTIKSQFASKLAVGFQNILRKNLLPVVSLVSPRETCLVIEGGTKPACNQERLLVSNPGGILSMIKPYTVSPFMMSPCSPCPHNSRTSIYSKFPILVLTPL